MIRGVITMVAVDGRSREGQEGQEGGGGRECVVRGGRGVCVPTEGGVRSVIPPGKRLLPPPGSFGRQGERAQGGVGKGGRARLPLPHT